MFHELVEPARYRMRLLGYGNVRIVEGDGTLGWPEEAPFDAIVAAASGSHVPKSWIAQLKPGGRIVMMQNLRIVAEGENSTGMHSAH